MRMKGNSVYDRRLDSIKKIERADYGGVYVGSPGRDVYHMLQYLSDNQMKIVAKKLADKFPIKRPSTNSQYSACIRFIYGQFEKQGVLRSSSDLKRMKREGVDWSLSRKFLKLLEKELKKENKNHGLVILYEMEGHRSGDEAIIDNNSNKMYEMEQFYLKGIKSADKCNSYKHMFSLYYWASQYFKKFGNGEKRMYYSKKAIKQSLKYYHKYFPSGDRYYSNRLGKTFSYVNGNDPKFGKKIMKKVVNEKLKKAFK